MLRRLGFANWSVKNHECSRKSRFVRQLLRKMRMWNWIRCVWCLLFAPTAFGTIPSPFACGRVCLASVQIRVKYEAKLAAEKRSTLLLKGENGIMRKKFSQLNKELAEQKDELRALKEKDKEMGDVIKGLDKDILGHKKEIREREETVMDKDKRIYDLRKKNQELEKFKFVLNYKIQELKRQIMPKKKEIQDMRDQMKEMEVELLQYHKSNAALDLMIGIAVCCAAVGVSRLL
jgi:hypothetical protein